MHKQQCNLILLLQCGYALFDAKQKNNSGKASLMFFRFALVLRAYSKWGVPQTPESNTKVLLYVARCAKLWFWIKATSLVLSVTKPGCTNSGATWFCYAKVAYAVFDAKRKTTAVKHCYCFPLCGCATRFIYTSLPATPTVRAAVKREQKKRL